MNNVICDGKSYVPSKIICVGRNYPKHASELDNPIPNEPVIFIKPNSAISTTLFSSSTEVHHYEAEICLMIKNGQYHAIGVGLDVTKRALQLQLKANGLPWEMAKAFDGSALFSCFDLLNNRKLADFSIELWVEKQLEQKGAVTEMIFSPDYLLKYLNKFFTLNDGDIIMTGTPNGVGQLESKKDYEISLLESAKVVSQHKWKAV